MTLLNSKITPQLFIGPGYTSSIGAMTAPCLNNALKDYTNEKASLGLTSISRCDAYWHIREGQSCARMLVNWQGIETQWHWTLMYGSFRVDRALTTDYYFLQVDNSTLIGYADRITRDVTDNDHYTILQWFDAIFPIYDYKISQ